MCGRAPGCVVVGFNDLARGEPKIASSMKQINVVGEHFHRDEAKGATHGGALGRENVGTSNHNAGEIPARRKTKVSFAMSISEGLVGPKPMANAVGDGHMVNIP